MICSVKIPGLEQWPQLKSPTNLGLLQSIIMFQDLPTSCMDQTDEVKGHGKKNPHLCTFQGSLKLIFEIRPVAPAQAAVLVLTHSSRGNREITARFLVLRPRSRRDVLQSRSVPERTGDQHRTRPQTQFGAIWPDRHDYLAITNLLCGGRPQWHLSFPGISSNGCGSQGED